MDDPERIADEMIGHFAGYLLQLARDGRQPVYGDGQGIEVMLEAVASKGLAERGAYSGPRPDLYAAEYRPTALGRDVAAILIERAGL